VGAADGGTQMKTKFTLKKAVETLLEILKVALLFAMMTLGFFISFAFVLFALGVTLTNFVLALLFVAACLSELGYIRWISN
jgi:hypothetical protein